MSVNGICDVVDDLWPSMYINGGLNYYMDGWLAGARHALLGGCLTPALHGAGRLSTPSQSAARAKTLAPLWPVRPVRRTHVAHHTRAPGCCVCCGRGRPRPRNAPRRVTHPCGVEKRKTPGRGEFVTMVRISDRRIGSMAFEIA